MSRPPKCRRVEFMPLNTFFKPAGVPASELEEVQMSVEELEAIRLKDLLGLEQEACAEKMGISRPTYHRILTAARSKIAEALVEGKAIRVEGGNFEVVVRRFKCFGCGNDWELPCGVGPRGSDINCPDCDGSEVYRISESGHPFGCRWQKRQQEQEN
ncbi:MAG: DUF134 domain-containing protein [Firmicutes bacterium]|nr:DUF134 domain-containing protein [Bacillota bacterium]